MGGTRKLAMILASDVAGLAGLPGRTKERTLAPIRNLRSDLIDPIASVRRGRIVKRTGEA
jgi:adenylate cyclase